jgi:hypothetical protein
MKFMHACRAALVLLGMSFTLSGCVLHEREVVHEPVEGYYDADRHRFYHEHEWHTCTTDDDRHCR